MATFYQGGYKRICTGSRCVNPWHYIAKERPEGRTRGGIVLEAEGEMEEACPESYASARREFTTFHPPTVVLTAYRNLRQDGFLKPQDCRRQSRGYAAA